MTAVIPQHFESEFADLFDRLMRVDGKAEIFDGRIVSEDAAGAWPNIAAGHIVSSLLSRAKEHRNHFAASGCVVFRLDLPNRQSFSPDAAYFIGPSPKMGPFLGAPIFAVEVRSLGDYGQRAEQLIAAKRADYFAAGTKVVWDVDILTNDVVKSYRAEDPATPLVFRPGEIAHAEPALPGWSVAVSDILPDDWEPPNT